ncbi:Cutinase transcription factor 1 alpha [Talaromyces islandicus]|uniref:Cutinase transcription factor 1 alpha n=1 Tax=Talaromyces islandicus TaxID=28573 RepID=A0A0U1M2Z0_TALIS|nr:Cutinase transcription factor 1 alpha [Talaromyces islandicus]
MFATFSTSTLDNREGGEPKPKRRQVLRACEACRIKRSKCDDSTPCAACVSRNWVCSRSGSSSDEPKSLASALMQISSLKEKIRTLEELQPLGAIATPASSNADSLSGRDTIVEWRDIIEKRRFFWPEDPVHYVKNWQTSYFGNFSSERFIARVKSHCNRSADKSFNSIDSFDLELLPTSCRQPRDLSEPSILGGGMVLESEVISKTQQRQYIRQFWDLHHPLFPILCENDITEYFESLWIPASSQSSQRTRAPSALADIVIAICALAKSSPSKQPLGQQSQDYSPSSNSLGAPSSNGFGELTDAGISVWHYRRCQRLLDDELDNPTAFTVQAQILMAIYLNTTSRVSAAYNVLGTAVRIAYSLGLHRDPPASLGITKVELRRRIWWSLYILDSKLSMELGRPMIVDLNTSNCQLPADDAETARISCLQSYFSTTEMTWLTYIVHAARLCTIVQSIGADVYNDGSNNCSTFHQPNINMLQTPPSFSSTAEHLEKKLSTLQAWVDAIPSDLRLPRTGGAKGPSTDVSSLYFDRYAPRWMQNQRIFLEIEYHNTVMTLIRPLVPVNIEPEQSKDVLQSLVTRLTDHASAIIQICHQCSLDTDVYSDHPELSSILWTAAVTLLYRLNSIPFESEASKHVSDSVCLVSEILGNVDGIDPTALEVIIRLRQSRQKMGDEWKRPLAGFNMQENAAANLPLGTGMDLEQPLLVPPAVTTVSDGVHPNLELGPTQSNLEWDPDFWLSIGRSG